MVKLLFFHPFFIFILLLYLKLPLLVFAVGYFRNDERFHSFHPEHTFVCFFLCFYLAHFFTIFQLSLQPVDFNFQAMDFMLEFFHDDVVVIEFAFVLFPQSYFLLEQLTKALSLLC